MNRDESPWTRIPAPRAGRIARQRVSANTTGNTSWIRDEYGRAGLLIEISRTIHAVTLQKARIKMNDVLVDITDVEEEGLRALIIILQSPDNEDVFLKLCIDLIEQAGDALPTEDVFDSICQRLRKWQSLLAGSTRNLLSSNQLQGLYGELYFIATALEAKPHMASVLLQGWKGPQRHQHDFVLSDTAVEVKSIASSSRGVISISSEDQLETFLASLYLQLYIIRSDASAEIGESLNAIVRRIRRLIPDSQDRQYFENNLIHAGYIDIADYELPLFQVTAARTYQVREDFPRIRRAHVPDGITAITYALLLDRIEPYRVQDFVL